jgi:hypothetical protein
MAELSGIGTPVVLSSGDSLRQHDLLLLQVFGVDFLCSKWARGEFIGLNGI